MTDETGYRKSLGLVELVSLGVGGTIGSGIFVVPGIAAGIAGPSSILAWAVVALSACCVALSLAWIQARSPSGTTFTAIFEPVFGPRISGVIVSIYLVSSVLSTSLSAGSKSPRAAEPKSSSFRTPCFRHNAAIWSRCSRSNASML